MIARFEVVGAEPAAVAGHEADWVQVLVFTKAFPQGIGTARTAEATTLFMAAGPEGTRSYVATERIVGRDASGLEGQVVVQHGGLESDPSTWFGHVVPGTGTGPFEGWAGSARIRHDEAGAFFEIGLGDGPPTEG